MARMLSFFKGPAEEEPPASVLAAWNQYASGIEDAEAGAARSGTGVSSSVSGSMGKIGDVARRIGTTVKDTAATGAAHLGAGVPSSTPLHYALFLFGAGAFMLMLAIFVALPVIVISPSKFAISFTLGNLLVIAGAGSLSGWRAQAAHACSTDRAPLTAGYAVSAVGTLWAALVAHSYLLSLVCSFVQVCALTYYTASYIPGGAAGARLLFTASLRAAGSCFGAAMRRA